MCLSEYGVDIENYVIDLEYNCAIMGLGRRLEKFTHTLAVEALPQLMEVICLYWYCFSGHISVLFHREKRLRNETTVSN